MAGYVKQDLDLTRYLWTSEILPLLLQDLILSYILLGVAVFCVARESNAPVQNCVRF